MAGHAFPSYLRLSSDFDNQQVVCCFTDTESAKCLANLSLLVYLHPPTVKRLTNVIIRAECENNLRVDISRF